MSAFPILAAILLAAAAGGAAGEGRGKVALSDGTAVEGALSLGEGRRLTLEPEGEGRGTPLLLDLADVAAIEFRAVSESIERPWTFKTPGSDEKVYGEGEYPLREIRARVRLKDGTLHAGRLMTFALHVRLESGEERKVLVKSQQKGEVGQSLADLVYPTRIELAAPDAGRGEPPAGRPLDVAWQGPRIREARLVGTRRRQVYEAALVEGGFRAEGLPDDSYDAALLTESGIFLGLSAPAPRDDEEIEGDPLLLGTGSGSASPLGDGERDAVRRKLAAINEFFEGRAVAAWAGGKGGLATGVRLTREGRMSDGRGGGRATIAHDEVWLWHAAGEDWVIDKRLSLFRREQAPGEPPPGWTILPSLAGLPAAGKAAATAPPRIP